jgi:hypothetical protein
MAPAGTATVDMGAAALALVSEAAISKRRSARRGDFQFDAARAATTLPFQKFDRSLLLEYAGLAVPVDSSMT